VKLVERSWIERRLLLQVRDTHPEFSVCEPELEATMAALSWFHDGGGRYVQKRSFQRTSDSDSTERSLGFKLLLGTLPVMMRQTAWYPDAYPEPEMRTCPKGHPPDDPKEETLAHFLECPRYDSLPIRPAGSTAADNWMWEYITERRPFVGITTEDWDAAERALLDGQSTGEGRPSPTSGGKKRVQAAYRHKLNWVLACWKTRNDNQIERETASHTSPGKRRKIMKQQGSIATENRLVDGMKIS
ncbi:hypothetical protein LPJ61_003707, partial [Coemansia biformis]